jgi:hypothetical protein
VVRRAGGHFDRSRSFALTRSRIRARKGFSSGTSAEDGSTDCVLPSGSSGNSGSNPLVAFSPASMRLSLSPRRVDA